VSHSFSYGGQAVVEGVMIRGQRFATVACRKPGGEIVTRSEELTWAASRDQARQIPVLRGMLLLWETMQLGVRSLTFSSQIADGRDPATTISRASIFLAIALSVSVSAALFFVGPLLLTSWLEPRFGHASAVTFEGLIRLTVLLAYVWAIGFVPGVRRLFQHHGAEHKAVNAYEAGVPLTPENVQRFSVIHARCGTNFLLTVMLVSIVVFGLLGAQPLWTELLSRVLLIPLIAGIAYEVLRFTAAHGDNRFVRVLAQPSLELQSLTTREPSDEQVELAILALRSVLVLDGILVEEPDTALKPAAVRID
jgi:uncharacterized protein YqhQ